jgi:hypothetical protein
MTCVNELISELRAHGSKFSWECANAMHELQQKCMHLNAEADVYRQHWIAAEDRLKNFVQGDAPVQRNPDGYAYRYSGPYGGLRFNNGEEVNGSKPMEAVPYFLGSPAEPIIDGYPLWSGLPPAPDHTPDDRKTIAILHDALYFYANGHHFMMHDPGAWDAVSGEPANFYEDESNTATVEDGSIAKLALAGIAMPDDPDDYQGAPAQQEGDPTILAERDALRAFAQSVMEVWPYGDLDGGTLQDIAHEHGLLEPETRTEPCGENCACSESVTEGEFVTGVECYRKAPLLTGAAIAASTKGETQC